MSGVRRVALVTGASRGIGAGIARRLAAQDWAVAVNHHHSPADARRVVDDIRAQGGTAEPFLADVTDEAQVGQLVEQIAARLGPVDVLVVNATGPQPEVAVEDLTWQTHLDQLLYFVKSPTMLLQAVLPSMRERQHGRIIQIGSIIAEVALPHCSAYVAAKSAQLGLTRCWARELGPYNITVNLVAPGWIPVERHAQIPPAAVEQHAQGLPLRRMGTPADVAAAVCFLASDAASFITGERIAVDGGHTGS
jgi:3-oxoacyl-[acyl-carrier protein] reductase